MTQAPAEAPELPDVLAVSTRRAAELLGISRRYLYDLISAGEIKTSQPPSTRSGKPYYHLIEIAELKAFLARTRQTA